MLKIKDLLPDEANFNTGTEFGNSLIDKSLSKFGAGRSILIDKNNRIIAGNKTIENAAANGFDDVVIVETTGEQIVAVKRTDIDLNTKKGREMALADNATAKANISWDAQTLTEWDMPLQEWGIDLTDITEVEPAGDADAEPQIDKAAELNKKWGVVSGDLWQIGEHRLLCGDSTKREDVERLMDGQKAELLFTSPPYSDMRTYEGDKQLSTTHLANFLDVWADCSSFLAVNLGLQFKDAEVVSYWDDYLAKAREVGLKLLAWNVWDKTKAGSVAQATNMFLLTHEWIFVFGSGRKRLNRTIPNQLDKYEAIHGKDWQKGSKRTVRQQDGSMASTTTATYTHHQLHSVIQQTPELSDLRKNHPAMFPVGLPTSYISAMTQAGDIVTESFCGSGTTMVACENLQRRCFGMELSFNYCAVILERMSTAFPDLEIKRIDG